MRKKWKNKTHEMINGKSTPTKPYYIWHHMLHRSYSENCHRRCPSYIGCSVCEEWHDFDNFREWFIENHKEGYHLDKDLLQQGNKVYSPSTCVFLPPRINTLLIECNRSRGDYPIGVYYDKRYKKFKAQCNNGKGKKVHLGCFDNPTDAHQAYKTYKYALIRKIAEEALSNKEINQRTHDALLKWKVESDR